MTTSPNPAARHSGRRFFGLVIVHLVVGVIGGSIWWFYDDSDLDVVRARARTHGHPLSWNDLGLTLADDARLSQWKRVTDLVARLKSYQSLTTPQRQQDKPYHLWDPVPDQMRTHHATLDGAAIAELMELLDRLGETPLVLYEQSTYSPPMREIDVARNLMRFLQERVLLAEPADVGILCRRMLAVTRRYWAGSLIQHSIRNSFIDVVLSAIARRLVEVKQHDPAIATEILSVSRRSNDDLRWALDGNFVMLFDALTRRDSEYGLGLGARGLYTPVITRAGRQRTLMMCLDAIEHLRPHDFRGSLAWAREADAEFRTAQTGFPYPSLTLHEIFMPVWSHSFAVGERTALRARLLAAELLGNPWPADSFDKDGQGLRPITRDGRVIAAYSVDIDGIDQGGVDKLDRIFPLYAKP